MLKVIDKIDIPLFIKINMIKTQTAFESVGWDGCCEIAKLMKTDTYFFLNSSDIFLGKNKCCIWA